MDHLRSRTRSVRTASRPRAYVLFAILRYIYLVEQKGEGGAPDETLLKDGPILVTVALYVLTAIGIMSAEKVGWIS
jgi:hypothetical protein